MRYNDCFWFKNIGISGDEWRAECLEKVVGKDIIPAMMLPGADVRE